MLENKQRHTASGQQPTAGHHVVTRIVAVPPMNRRDLTLRATPKCAATIGAVDPKSSWAPCSKPQPAVGIQKQSGKRKKPKEGIFSIQCTDERAGMGLLRLNTLEGESSRIQLSVRHGEQLEVQLPYSPVELVASHCVATSQAAGTSKQPEQRHFCCWCGKQAVYCLSEGHIGSRLAQLSNNLCAPKGKPLQWGEDSQIG